MDISLKSDNALATPGTSKVSRCNIETLKARLKEQKEAALVLRQQATVNKKKTNLEYRKSQRKKVNKEKSIENDVSNSQYCISENGIESIGTTFTSSEQKQQFTPNSVTETPRLKKLSLRLSGTPQRKQKKVKKAHNVNPVHRPVTSIPTSRRKTAPSQKDDNTSTKEETGKPDEVTKGEWVAVCYDNSWYPGIIEKIENNVITVLYKHRSGDKFFWPRAEDRHSLPVTEIMCRIQDPPQPISTRFSCINNVKDYDKLFLQLFSE